MLFTFSRIYCVYAMPISWNQFMKWANSCVHKHIFMNSITHESWLWIQPQYTNCWGTAYFTAYYSIELYIKFKKFDSCTNIISWFCLCCINRGYYNFVYWRKHEIHGINIVIFRKLRKELLVVAKISLVFYQRLIPKYTM